MVLAAELKWTKPKSRTSCRSRYAEEKAAMVCNKVMDSGIGSLLLLEKIYVELKFWLVGLEWTMKMPIYSAEELGKRKCMEGAKERWDLKGIKWESKRPAGQRVAI